MDVMLQTRICKHVAFKGFFFLFPSAFRRHLSRERTVRNGCTRRQLRAGVTGCPRTPGIPYSSKCPYNHMFIVFISKFILGNAPIRGMIRKTTKLRPFLKCIDFHIIPPSFVQFYSRICEILHIS